jgi:hypothetical protein
MKNNLNYFKEGKVLDKKVSYMTYDIESLFISSDNPKYKMEHKPFLICYDIIYYNKITDEEEFKQIHFDNKLLN